MRSLLIGLAMLAAFSPAMLPRESRGALVGHIQSDAGVVAVYRDALGCLLTIDGKEMDQVSWAICSG